jgi:nucleotide-binding universal stress UspA family protein
VLAWAARFAAEFGSKLTLVHAIPAAAERLDGIYFDAAWHDDILAHARTRIEALKNDLAIDADIVIESGDIPGAVRTAAKSTDADLLVVGRGHPHGMLGRLRTNTYGIVRESPCPVIAV